MNTEDQIKAYGCTLAELNTQVLKSMEIGHCGPVQIAMAYTTFAKNMVAADNKVGAIQYLNRLRWLLSTYVMDDGE